MRDRGKSLHPRLLSVWGLGHAGDKQAQGQGRARDRDKLEHCLPDWPLVEGSVGVKWVEGVQEMRALITKALCQGSWIVSGPAPAAICPQPGFQGRMNEPESQSCESGVPSHPSVFFLLNGFTNLFQNVMWAQRVT